MLRKINAVISLFITVLLMTHAINNAVWMLSMGRFILSINKLSWVLFCLMMVHAIISIVLAILGHKGAEKRKCNGYPNLNKQTYIQRASGVLLIVFTVLHVLGTIGVMNPPRVIHAILPPLFFTLSLAHVAVSGSKAFISLGLGNAKFVKVADVFIKLLCIATLLADVIGFYLFLV